MDRPNTPRNQLAPSILSFDLSKLGPDLKELERLGADRIHLDVMDGQFVPPITFGDAYVSSIRPYVKAPFEAHLMTLTPERHFEPFAKAGCQTILFHVEATAHAHRLAQTLREMGVRPGVVLNPGTPACAVSDLLDVVDQVLVMTVNPGWGGQKFLESPLGKIGWLRDRKASLDIEVDGGINPSTLARVIEAGANVFVVGNYLASAPDMAAAYEALRRSCGLSG